MKEEEKTSFCKFNVLLLRSSDILWTRGPGASSQPPPSVRSYLQVRDPLLEGLRVLPQQPLLLQELGVVAVGGGLEQAVVQDVPQGLGQGAEDLLLGLPHGGVGVEAQTFLQGEQGSV